MSILRCSRSPLTAATNTGPACLQVLHPTNPTPDQMCWRVENTKGGAMRMSLRMATGRQQVVDLGVLNQVRVDAW